MLPNPKHFDNQPGTTSGKFCYKICFIHKIIFKIPYKINLWFCMRGVYETYMNFLFCLWSYPSDISLFTCKYTQIKKKNQQSKTHLAPSISVTGNLTCTTEMEISKSFSCQGKLE